MRGVRRVLVVEDDPRVLALGRLVLEDAGYDLVTAPNAGPLGAA
jgi:CheY-like chemotaxis protein